MEVREAETLFHFHEYPPVLPFSSTALISAIFPLQGLEFIWLLFLLVVVVIPIWRPYSSSSL